MLMCWEILTKEEVKAFKQPVAAERLVPLTANELEEGYETKVSVEVAGETGVVQGMGMDGRVRVTFENEQIEDQVWLRTKPAAVKDLTKGGVWLDLTKIEHTFAEEIKEQMAVLQEIPMADGISLMQRVFETTARGAPAAENRLIVYSDAAWPGTAQQNRELRGPLRWQAQVYTWAELEAVLCKMRWIMGQNEVAARMIWLLLCRFHNGYEKWDDVQEAIDMMFFVALSWLLQKAVGKFAFSRGSSVARLSKDALMRGLVQYKEETIATPKYVVDKLPWPRYVQRGVRVLNDIIYRARYDRVSTMDRGQCESVQASNRRRVQLLVRDYSRVDHGATSSQSVRTLAVSDDGTHDSMPDLVSESDGTSTSSEVVFEEF